MMLKKFLRYVLLTLAGVACFLIIFLIISLAPVERKTAEDFSFYQTMMTRLDQMDVQIPRASKSFSVGFSKTNITPADPMATAGYGKRMGRPYRAVHDSIYVRTMVIDNGVERVAIVSADLLIMPPTVTRVLGEKLSTIGFSLDNTYLGAIHSHNSIGHWGEGATRFIYGAYSDTVVAFIADAIVNSIRKASVNRLPATLKSGSILIPEAVENRLIDSGPEDPFLRVIEVHRSDSSKAMLLSYAAHATCLSQGTLELSRDYPGVVVDDLESKDYSFAMFLAGAVGSHKGSSGKNNWECMAWMAKKISAKVVAGRNDLRLMTDTALIMKRVLLPLSEPQVKLSEDWKLRSWVFNSAFGKYEAFITALRIGNVVMLGTPCDFSGELTGPLDSLADHRHMQAIVTSFNGGYIGYVTPGKYYDRNHYETRLMNWYAPGTGEYIQKSLAKLMVAVSDTR